MMLQTYFHFRVYEYNSIDQKKIDLSSWWYPINVVCVVAFLRRALR